MAPERFILALVFLIVFISTIVELIFNGLSLKPILLFIASAVLVLFLWNRGQKKD
jgi:hypothetical protein